MHQFGFVVFLTVLLTCASAIGTGVLKVLKLPLTPVPVALAHVDGTVMESNKSKLMHKQ